MCRTTAHGAWPQGHSLHPGEGAGAGTWSSGGLGRLPGTHGWGGGGQQGGVHLWPLLPLCEGGRAVPRVEPRDGAPRAGGLWLALHRRCFILRLPSPPCLSLTLPEPGSATFSEDPLLFPAPLSPAMPLSDEITSAQVSPRALCFMERLKISQKQRPPAAPSLHTPAPLLRTSRGRITRLEMCPEKARPPRSLLSSCQTSTAGEKKGRELKMMRAR